VALPLGNVHVDDRSGPPFRCCRRTAVESGPAADYVLSATPLQNGRVLVVESTQMGGAGQVSAELFDPAALP
jgi:hypothetical protein